MKLNLCQQRKTEAGPKTPCALKLQSSPQLGLHRKLTKILPLPFGRGEGWGEGSILKVVASAARPDGNRYRLARIRTFAKTFRIVMVQIVA